MYENLSTIVLFSSFSFYIQGTYFYLPQGTASRIGGVTFNIVSKEMVERHALSYGDRECDTLVLRNPGFYHWRNGGEKHINDPQSIASLQVKLLLCILCGLFELLFDK